MIRPLPPLHCALALLAMAPVGCNSNPDGPVGPSRTIEAPADAGPAASPPEGAPGEVTPRVRPPMKMR